MYVPTVLLQSNNIRVFFPFRLRRWFKCSSSRHARDKDTTSRRRVRLFEFYTRDQFWLSTPWLVDKVDSCLSPFHFLIHCHSCQTSCRFRCRSLLFSSPQNLPSSLLFHHLEIQNLWNHPSLQDLKYLHLQDSDRELCYAVCLSWSKWTSIFFGCKTFEVYIPLFNRSTE